MASDGTCLHRNTVLAALPMSAPISMQTPVSMTRISGSSILTEPALTASR